MRKASRLPPLSTSILLAAIGDVERHFYLPTAGAAKSKKKPWRKANEQREIQDMMRRRR